MSRTRTALGIVITVLWLALMFGLFLTSDAATRPSKLNEWGDFFAGVFAPVAFLWLVLGYLQQGQELRLSTRALELQTQELQQSVEQQRQLVMVSREQVTAEVEALAEERRRRRQAALPNFVVYGLGASLNGGRVRYKARVENFGNAATSVVASFEPPLKICTLSSSQYWQPRGMQDFEYEFFSSEAEAGTSLTIRFSDADGVPGAQQFALVVSPASPGALHSTVEYVRSAA